MAGNPLASLPGLPQRPSLARSSASETRLTQPGIEGARSRKLNSAPTAAFRVKDRAPHFRGLKNTDTDVGLVTGAFARLGRDFRIFAGLELPTLPMLAIGGCGMMITASNVAPRMVSQLYDTFAKGDIDGAIALNLKLYPLFRGVALESSPIPVKYMLKRLGVLNTNEHRPPMAPASPEIERQLDKVLADIGLV